MARPEFHLPHFLPYLLNQAGEAVSAEFQAYYRDRYGMLRTEWRVLFHLGCYGDMTARQICDRSALHKTKVSRAVAALEQKRYLSRQTDPDDRRHERLALTRAGRQVFRDLHDRAEAYERTLSRTLTDGEIETLRRILRKLAEPEART